MFPNWSFAVTVRSNADPAVWGLAALLVTTSVLVAAGATVIAVLLPVIPGVAWSVAVTTLLPAVSSVAPAANVCVPLSPVTKV